MPNTLYVAIRAGSRQLLQQKLMGLTLLDRLLLEARLAGYGKAVLLCAEAGLPSHADGSSTQPGIGPVAAPAGMTVDHRQIPVFDTIEELTPHAAGEPGAAIIDSGCLFQRGLLGKLAAEGGNEPLAGMLPSGPAWLRTGTEGGKRRGIELAGRCIRLTGGREELRAAKWLLLNGLRKPMLVDGVVGAYLMRPVTLRISSLLANTPVRPNHVTAFCMALGLTGAGLIAFGQSHLLMVLGLLLYFVGATLDCVDGELARVKYQGSLVGAWFDTLSDDLSTSALVAAMGSYLTWSTGNGFHAWLGWAGALCFLAGQLYLYYFLLTRFHSGDVLDFVWAFQDPKVDKSERHGPADYAMLLTKRDFFSLFLLICGATGLLAFGATVVSIACVCYIGLVFWDLAARLRAAAVGKRV